MKKALTSFLSLSLLAACSGSGPERYSPKGAKNPPGGSNVENQNPNNSNTGVDVPNGGNAQLTCNKASPGKSPIRRLTRFEYNNTVRDILFDASQPALSLPAENLGNGFGNDAGDLGTSSLLANQYATVAARVSEAAFSKAEFIKLHAACLATATGANEEACVKSFLGSFLPKAYRRPAVQAEIDEYVALFKALKPNAANTTQILKDLLTTILQSPDFLYRVEFGQDSGDGVSMKLNGYEMASRLSYLFWATAPDDALMKAAESGALATREGVMKEAERLIANEKFQKVQYYFFDNLLPINDLTHLERDKDLYPTFNPEIGSLMYQETHKFLDYILLGEGPGDWSAAFSANYTFLNEKLAKFYGIEGVTGEEFRKVTIDGRTRLGLLTQGAWLAGTTHSSSTNPVLRGVLITKKLLCRPVPAPTGDLAALATPPKPTAGTTARERFTRHSEDPACVGCHTFMDPLGLTFENYDAVGLYRLEENNKMIDASGALPDVVHNGGPVANAIELSQRLSKSKDLQDCFAENWMTYAYGKTLQSGDSCSKTAMKTAAAGANYNFKKMLLQLTQTDAFFLRPVKD